MVFPKTHGLSRKGWARVTSWYPGLCHQKVSEVKSGEHANIQGGGTYS